jgi:hypothetical protein
MLSDSWNTPWFDAPSPDDGEAAQEVVLGVAEVHGAALALADAGGPTVELGHQRLGGGLAAQRVPVVAVGGHDVVVAVERRDRARRHRFLADVQVGEAADEAVGVGLGDALLEAPDEHHLAVHVDLVGVGNGQARSPWARTG